MYNIAKNTYFCLQTVYNKNTESKKYMQMYVLKWGPEWFSGLSIKLLVLTQVMISWVVVLSWTFIREST